MTMLRLTLASAGVLVCAARLAAQSTFQGIGFLPAAAHYSYPLDISGDGSTVAGAATDTNSAGQPVRWRQATGVVSLGEIPGVWSLQANGESISVSHDGSVVVGSSPGPAAREAFRWTQATGMVGLGNLGGVPNSAAYGERCSDNGSVVVGTGDYTFGTTGILSGEAFRWTQATGMVGLGQMATSGLLYTSAKGCSADGSVVVGYGTTDQGWEAFRWTQATGMVALGDHPGGAVDSAAISCTADGNTIVGWILTDTRYEPATWTQATGWVSLGTLPVMGLDNFAADCTPDGSVVVGACNIAYGGLQGQEFSGQAFIWDAASGMRDIKEQLLLRDVNAVVGWSLFVAAGVSADGTTIAGVGLNPQGEYEGWVAHLEGSSTCYPDCNGDGQLSVADFGCFQTKYVLGCP
ncbi:MAG: PEP-CTERM sorting domain-containing protein [Phycisphaerales bacterium]